MAGVGAYVVVIRMVGLGLQLFPDLEGSTGHLNGRFCFRFVSRMPG